MVFQGNAFRGMRKGHKMKHKHLFSFQKRCNRCNMISPIFGFYFQAGDFLVTIVTLAIQKRTFIYFVKHCERFCEAKFFFSTFLLFLLFFFLDSRLHHHPKFPVFPRTHYFGLRWDWCNPFIFFAASQFHSSWCRMLGY